jgi:hypothetical protein
VTTKATARKIFFNGLSPIWWRPLVEKLQPAGRSSD